jgi:glycosyltransferase involved in cell wall biosynthesis
MSIDAVTGGGTAERTYQMCRALARAGVKCALLTTDLGLTQERRAALQGIQIIALPCLVERFAFFHFDFQAISEAVKEADIIHAMNHWTVLNALVYLVARYYGKPYVVCPAGALPIWGRSRVIKYLFNLLVGNSLIKNAAGWVAITEDEKTQFLPYGVELSKIKLIPNGIDPDNFLAADTLSFRQKYQLGERKIILFVGRLNPIKGPDLLVEAFCQAKNAIGNYQLVFVGPDQGMRDSLEKTVKEAGLENYVHFIGYLGGQEKSNAYHAADLVVVPSRQEAMSIVALEAGICGTPVLLTDQCGFTEVAAVGGGVITPVNAEAIAAALKMILNNRELLATMGKNLQALVTEKYTWKIIAQKYIQFFETVLSKHE